MLRFKVRPMGFTSPWGTLLEVTMDPHCILSCVRFLRKLQAGCGKAAERWARLESLDDEDSKTCSRAREYQEHGESHYSHAIGLLEQILDREAGKSQPNEEGS